MPFTVRCSASAGSSLPGMPLASSPGGWAKGVSLMAIGKGTDRLIGAIERCLAGCYRDESPVFRLSECLAQLRAEGWSESDLRHIELLVLKRLVGLMNQIKSDDDTVID
jgi:hypothetical protein